MADLNALIEKLNVQKKYGNTEDVEKARDGLLSHLKDGLGFDDDAITTMMESVGETYNPSNNASRQTGTVVRRR